MSNFSGISAILSVSLIALVTTQMLKDNLEMVENYGETDEQGNNLYSGDAYYTQTTSNNMNGVQDRARAMAPINDLSKLKHGSEPFKAEGDFFQGPYIASNANQWSGISDSYQVYMQNINNATPSPGELENIGSQTQFMPGPSEYMTDGLGGPNFNSGRAKNLSLCAQNAGTNGASALNVASSLLPSPGNLKMEGFGDCDVTNNLADQVFLTPQGQAGLMTNPGSNRNSLLDLRSAPPNPMLAVGPWNNSTIYPDLLRRPLEGCGPSFGVYGNGAMGSGVPTTIQ